MNAIDVRPVTPDRWEDLEALFGPNGAYSGCWCTWWRVSSKTFEAESAAGRRNLLRALVNEGPPPGLLAYRGGRPVGWVSLGERSAFGRLQRSPKLKPIDGTPVCSIVCFFIDRGHRRSGVASTLLDAAIEHARRAGFETVEGYPIDTTLSDRGAAGLFTGTLDLFERAGFAEVARRGGRPIVRHTLD